jgi:hypothetical protein
MKNKHKAIIFFAVLIPLVVSYFGFREWFVYSLFRPRILKVHPDKSKPDYAAVFKWGALQGGTLYFGANTHEESESKLQIIGPVNYVDYPLRLQRIVVSSDETFVATESSHRSDFLWLAYDFQNCRAYGTGTKPYDEDPYVTKERNNSIKEILKARGGVGQEYSVSDVYDESNKMSWFSWRRWVPHVEKAIKNSQRAGSLGDG